MINYPALIEHISTDGYHIIDNFLDEKLYQALRKQAQSLAENGLLRKAKIGQKQTKQRNEDIRTDEIFWLDERSDEVAIQSYLDTINDLAKNFNQSLFLNLQEFETHFAAYQPGTYYKKHVDQFAHNKSRKISFVYYLNDSWQQEYGGELKLYSADDQLIHSVSPIANRFICFNSELAHEVCTTYHTRYSITGWMKTRA